MALFQQILNMAAQPNMGMQPNMIDARFDRVFKAVPMSYAPHREHTADVDVGNKVLLPASALEELSRMNIQVTKKKNFKIFQFPNHNFFLLF